MITARVCHICTHGINWKHGSVRCHSRICVKGRESDIYLSIHPSKSPNPNNYDVSRRKEEKPSQSRFLSSVSSLSLSLLLSLSLYPVSASATATALFYTEK